MRARTMTMKRIARHAFAAVILLSVAVPVAAQQGKIDPVTAAGLNALNSGDYATALLIWRSRADKGDARAQASLGSMYALGRGVPEDQKVAAGWYRKAADQGDLAAQVVLGGMYERGNGVPQDYVLAHMWLNLAAAQGNEGAATLRNLVATKMTPAQIAEAQKLAREWKSK
jgi:uncharacterized protein